AYVFSGSATTGPFASKVVVAQTQANLGLSGMALVGGGVSGRDEIFSLIGDATPDLVMLARDSASFVILDGRTVRSTASPIDADAKAAVTLPVPAGWGGTGEGGRTLITDLDGDGYADFAGGNALGGAAGKVIAYW